MPPQAIQYAIREPHVQLLMLDLLPLLAGPVAGVEPADLDFLVQFLQSRLVRFHLPGGTSCVVGALDHEDRGLDVFRIGDRGGRSGGLRRLTGRAAEQRALVTAERVGLIFIHQLPVRDRDARHAARPQVGTLANGLEGQVPAIRTSRKEDGIRPGNSLRHQPIARGGHVLDLEFAGVTPDRLFEVLPECDGAAVVHRQERKPVVEPGLCRWAELGHHHRRRAAVGVEDHREWGLSFR